MSVVLFFFFLVVRCLTNMLRKGFAYKDTTNANGGCFWSFVLQIYFCSFILFDGHQGDIVRVGMLPESRMLFLPLSLSGAA